MRLHTIIGAFSLVLMLVVGIVTLIPDFRTATDVVQQQESQFVESQSRLANLHVEHEVDRLQNYINILAAQLSTNLEGLTEAEKESQILSVLYEGALNETHTVAFIPVSRQRSIITMETLPAFLDSVEALRQLLPLESIKFVGSQEASTDGFWVSTEIISGEFGQVQGYLVGRIGLEDNISLVTNLQRLLGARHIELSPIQKHEKPKTVVDEFRFSLPVEPFDLQTRWYLNAYFEDSASGELVSSFFQNVILKILFIVVAALVIAVFASRWIKKQTEQFSHHLKSLATTGKSEQEYTSVAGEINDISQLISELVTNLMESESVKHAILSNSGALVYLKRIDGQYEFVNQTYLDTTGFAESDVLGHTDIDLFGAEKARPFMDNDKLVAEKKEVINFEEKLHMPGRDVATFLSVKFPIFNQYGFVQYVCGFSSDITYIKEIEHDLIVQKNEAEDARHQVSQLNASLERRVEERTELLKKAQSELIQSEKLASLGALVAGVAHEINTPLGISITTQSMLEDSFAKLQSNLSTKSLTRSQMEATLADCLEATQLLGNSLHRMVNLVDSFKQISVDQMSEAKRKFNAWSTVNDIVNALRPMLKKTQTTISLSGDDNVPMSSYPGALTQVISNLVVNAQIHGYEQSGGDVHIEVQRNKDNARIVISDTGKGMTHATIEKIFDPFFTTRMGSGGSGLGLHITHNIVTGPLNGQIACESAGINQGSEFQLTLPLIVES